MRTRYRISVGGVQMDSLDSNLIILDISNAQPDRTRQEYTVANFNGLDYGSEYVGRQTVTVTFELHIYDIKKRNAALQKVNAWAKAGGTLIINDREKQRLMNVVCQQYAEMTSVLKWTEPLTVVFATTYQPYWVSDTAVTRTLTGKSASGTLTMDGNVGSALVSVTVTAQGNVSSIQLVCGSTTLKLTGLNMTNGQKLVVDYSRNRYLRIRLEGSSVLTKLDPSSADNLLAECGKTSTVSVTANNKVTAVFTARGCWL